MSSHLDLTSLVGPSISKRSGPLVGAELAITSAASSAESPSEVALNQLRADDQLLIQTAHSTYIFLVLDRANRIGMVVGGAFGDYAERAHLEGVPDARDGCLRTGMRVRFHVESGAGRRRVTSSIITGLIHRKARTGPLR